MLLLRATAIWLLILGLAVLNGALRELVLLPSLGKPAALLLSGLLLSSFVVIVAIALAPWMGLISASRSLGVGALWLCLTLVFEFGFGRFVQGRSWPELLEAYAFKDGNIWPLVLAVIFFSPWLAARIRGRRQGASDLGS